MLSEFTNTADISGTSELLIIYTGIIAKSAALFEHLHVSIHKHMHSHAHTYTCTRTHYTPAVSPCSVCIFLHCLPLEKAHKVLHLFETGALGQTSVGEGEE